jgi:pimeloyl-ACP methyl ester carboxylesterase
MEPSEASMAEPTTGYARAGEVNIAYQAVGAGPLDLVWATGLASNIEVCWEEPSLAAFLRRLSEFTRLILFDRRGCGASDRGGTTATPTLEERMDDVIAVLDAVGSEQAAVFGDSEGGSLAVALAATHPQRVSSIILYGTVAHFRKDVDHPWGLFDQEVLADLQEWMRRGWGSVQGAETALELWAPSMVGDERFTAWFAKHARQSVSRDAIGPLVRSCTYLYDLIDVFPTVRVPALVLHRTDDPLVPVGQGHRLAELIPNAQLVELPGGDHLPFVGDAESILEEVEAFLVGSRTTSSRHGRLLTILVIDVADSPESMNLSQEAWRELLATHHEQVRAHLSRFAGQEVTGFDDGCLAAFEGPARAVRCALGIVDAATRRGLSVRAGVHTGECEVSDAQVRGVTVDIAVHIAGSAAPGQILASGTVRDLVPGSGIRFGERYAVELDGVVGPRAVFPVLSVGAPPETVRRFAIDRDNVLRRDGEYWTVAYNGLVVTLRDSKGLYDLAKLLGEPHREIHVLDLASSPAPPSALSSRAALEAGLRIQRRSGESVGEPILDETARAAYKRRIADLEQELSCGQATGDEEGRAEAQQELDALVDELTAAYGLGRRPRRTPDHVERARKTVSRRVRAAIDRIHRVHPGLGRHLRASVHTGIFCRYSPERQHTWTVDTAD